MYGIAIIEKDYIGTEGFTQETGYALRVPQVWGVY